MADSHRPHAPQEAADPAARPIRLALATLVALSLAAPSPAQDLEPGADDGPAVGPPGGALVVAGGGHLGPEIIGTFVRLAGGETARIVVIPTAGSADDYDQDWSGLEPFWRMGVAELTVLHTRAREVADSRRFVEPLRRATGAWFTGGRQWRLVDAYLNTRTHRELQRLLERGGVIGGSSAGASIQASYLVRGSPRGNHIMMAPGYEEGLGFLEGVAVDQHLLTRNRQNDLLEVLKVHPDLLGIGIDEGTALLVRGDRARVIGRSKVAIYRGDAEVDPSGLPYFFLEPGDRFDLRTLRVERHGNGR